MNKKDLLEKMLDIYRSSYDITERYEIGGEVYDAYAYCNIINSKYVLTKKAELWRVLCFEHVFFRLFDELTVEDIDRFCAQTKERIEPELVRGGRECMEKDHMYSYVTGIFICEKGISKEVKKKLRKVSFYKNYRFGFRGYCGMRLMAVDLENNKLTGNRAAAELIKEYKKLI